MRQLGMLILLTGSSALAQQYVISTYAGGAPPPTPASPLKASLGYPQSVAADPYGNVFFTSLNCVFKLDSSGTLTRIAGNSRPGFSGDGGPALNAQLFLPEPYAEDQLDYIFPSGLAVDYRDNVYVADQGNGRVRRISADGAITTVAGGGAVYTEGALATSVLIFPAGLAVDSTGNLFISGANFVRKVNPAGTISTVAGMGSFGFSGDGGPATAAQFNDPAGLAADGHGNLYIADVFNGRIRKVTPDGVITSVASINSVESLAVDSGGNIYAGAVDDSGDGSLFKVTADGTVTTLASNICSGNTGCSGLQPWGLAIDSTSNLLIAGGGNVVRKMMQDGTITTVAGNGTVSDSGDGGAAIKAQFSPNAVALDSAGNLYIADSTASRVRKVSPTATISTIAGNGTSGYSGDGGPATSAQVNPQALTVDAAGNLYIAETARVRKVSASGVITTVAGNGNPGYSGDGGPAIDAQLAITTQLGNAGLALDRAGNLYISEVANSRVRKISPDGVITTVAGNGQPAAGGDTGDGGAAINASLTPGALALDTAGNLYIGSQRVVRKVSPSGVIATVAGSPASASTYSGDGGPAIAAGLTVEGLAVDSSGNLFIADSFNGRVRVVSPNGIINTVAGSGSTYTDYGDSSYTGDGGLATNAKLYPNGLATDSGGNVYVADRPNGAVRLLQPVTGRNVSAIENAASGLTGPVAPGEMVVLFGFGLGPDQLSTAVPANDGTYPTSLGGTTLQINGVSAPLIYSSVTQVAAIVPESVTGATAQFTVTYQGQTTAAVSVPLAAAAPGIFTADSSGIGTPITINQNGAIDAVANGGDTLTVFATGLGQLPPTVLLDGSAFAPLSYGSLPGAEGITQIKFQIPIGQDCDTSIAISAGNASSQPGMVIRLSVCI